MMFGLTYSAYAWKSVCIEVKLHLSLGRSPPKPKFQSKSILCLFTILPHSRNPGFPTQFSCFGRSPNPDLNLNF